MLRHVPLQNDIAEVALHGTNLTVSDFFSGKYLDKEKNTFDKPTFYRTV